MEYWQHFLVALGGNAALLAVLAWLSKSLLSQFLTKDLDKFKGALEAEYATAAEKMKHDFVLLAAEHEVRFAKLHEKRAEVIAETHRLIREIDRTVIYLSLFLLEDMDESPRRDAVEEVKEAAGNLYNTSSKTPSICPKSCATLLKSSPRECGWKPNGFCALLNRNCGALLTHLLISANNFARSGKTNTVRPGRKANSFLMKKCRKSSGNSSESCAGSWGTGSLPNHGVHPSGGSGRNRLESYLAAARLRRTFGDEVVSQLMESRCPGNARSTFWRDTRATFSTARPPAPP